MPTFDELARQITTDVTDWRDAMVAKLHPSGKRKDVITVSDEKVLTIITAVTHCSTRHWNFPVDTPSLRLR